MIKELLNKEHIVTAVFDLSTLTPNGDVFFDGAIETLRMFRETETIMGLVAAAHTGWVKLALDHLDLRKRFDYFWMVDPCGYISPQDWKNALGTFWPQNAIIVGSGLSEDICEIGVRYPVCVSRNGEIFNAKREFERTIINIGSIADLASALGDRMRVGNFG